jgi:hypothetical protein
MAKAFGEQLADFPDLSGAERTLIKACRTGGECKRGDGKLPKSRTTANAIRPGLIRFLALGGDGKTPVHPHGVQLSGAWIAGDIDLEDCTCSRPLWLFDCRIAGEVVARGAHLPVLSLEGSRIDGLKGDRLRVEGDVFLRNGFTASGTVRLLGAQIGGNLDCSGGTFTPGEGDALSCDGAVIKGDVVLRNGFEASGTVRLLGAQIGGDLDCTGGTFTPGEGRALSCDRAAIKGSVFLGGGFTASGEVRLLGAQIGGDLTCSGGTFTPGEDRALSCDGGRISGSLFFRGMTAVGGAVDLVDCEVGALVDDAASWDKVPRLRLNGFRYGRIANGPTDAAARIAWLKRPQLEGYEHVFWPQPWEQLVKVLREMGHEEDARQVAIEKQEEMRRRGRIRPVARPFHWVFGKLAGYGYRPLRTVYWMIAVWTCCALFYIGAGVTGAMGPSDAITVEAHAATCGKPTVAAYSTWLTCPELPKEYTTFSPWLYSLDVILPLVDLQQEKSWSPLVIEDDAKTWIWRGVITRWVMWFEILFGWGASLLLAAVLGNLPKRD